MIWMTVIMMMSVMILHQIDMSIIKSRQSSMLKIVTKKLLNKSLNKRLNKFMKNTKMYTICMMK